MTELGEEHYPAWGELLYSVRTGGIAFDKAFRRANLGNSSQRILRTHRSSTTR